MQITQFLISTSKYYNNLRIGNLFDDLLTLQLIMKEDGQYIYQTYCYIKTDNFYISMYCLGENIYINKHDIYYNHVHDALEHKIFYPSESDDTYSSCYHSQTFGKFAITVFVEKPYYKYWLLKSLPLVIDIIGLIQHLLHDWSESNYLYPGLHDFNR